MDYARPELADALAAEYVAGTLRGPARRRFEALLPGHPALRDAVQAWERRLMPLTGAIEPEPPPARAWRAIEARLWVEPAPEPAPWWLRLPFWRGLASFATVAAVVLAVRVALPEDPLPPPVVVVLQGTGAGGAGEGSTGFVASVSGDGASLVMRPLQAVAQPGRVLELWSVPPEGAPRSLGLVDASGATVLRRDRLPPTLLRGGTSALAVSVEPPGGSPTGAPTGPVVYAGRLQL